MPKKANRSTKALIRQRQVLGLRKSGESIGEIARKINASKATVWKDLQQEDVREAIEEHIKYLSILTPLAREVHLELLVDEDSAIRQKALDTYYKVLGITGIQAPPFIQNILNIQTNVMLTPQMQQLLVGAIPREVIDVTPYRDTSKLEIDEDTECVEEG